MKPLLLAAVALTTLACNRETTESTATPDAALYSYIPPDAVFVAGARLNHLRASPVYARFRDQLPAEARLYEKEATELVMASDGRHSLVLARGKFDKQRLAREWKGGPFTFLGDDLLAIGDPAVVASAKRRAGASLAKQIPRAADLWAVTNGRLPLELPERSNLSNLNRLAQDLRLGVLAVNVTDAIRANAKFEFASEQASEQAQTAFRGFIGMARLSTPDGKEQLLQALDVIQVGRDKLRVDLNADWPAGLVDALLQSLPGRAAQ